MQKEFTFKQDITRKFLIFAIIPSLLLSLFLLFVIVDLKENLLKESHTKVLKNIDYKITSFYSELSAAEDMIVKSKGKEKNIYDNILHFREYISSIILVDKNGKIKKIFSNKEVQFDKKFDYSTVFDLPTFLETKKSFLGNSYSFPKSDELYIPYIFEHNGTIYIFNIQLEYFNTYTQNLLSEDKSVQVYIVDKNSTCIVNSLNDPTIQKKITFINTPISKAILVGKEHQLIKFSEKNKTLRATYINQKNTEWKIIIKDEFDKVYPFVQYILLIIGSFLLFLFILAIIVAKKVARDIVEPVESLILEIEEFANETEFFDISSNIKSKYYIFNILIESFDNMKSDIIDRELELKNLNEHLEEKTAELKTINQTLRIKLETQR
ncbi:MAG: cache domain-containing protein [Epsilonproteobacteria bacterium]|nr:cache domain-containing protein [Campylobacterota bacterium]